MNKKIILIVLIVFLSISLLSCANNERDEQQPEETQAVELPDEGIEIENVWARPGSVNGVSAVYMVVLNGSSEADTLLSFSSPVAEMVEVHETYESEDGMMGMREVKNITVSAQDALILEPGGFHLMLMQLNQDLAEGDEIELTVELSNAGEMTISVPVQTMQ